MAEERDEDDEGDSGSESESETEEEEDTGLTENQNRLLYLISLYTHKAETHDDKDEWIRKPALLVLIYEGIVANVLDYDYAPQSELIENRRVYLNISQVRAEASEREPRARAPLPALGAREATKKRGRAARARAARARRLARRGASTAALTSSSPQLRLVSAPQEGKSDIEFLREEELLNGLQIASRSYKPITCYQISEKGEELVKRVSQREKEATHEFVYAKGTRELLSADWDGNDYHLKSRSGYSRKSSINETEDVSYVSSAYVPQCLRYGGRPTLSNAHRAHESAVNTDNIRDELDEVITLNSVSIIVAEYIPFGANQIVQLNNNVGSTERVQGGFISPAIDDDSSGTNMEMSPELTAVDILDYTLTNHINFEAEIRFSEDSGVVQVETFGVSLNAEGTCFYGMQVEAVMDRIKDNISLDHLARLLVDVQQDSSAIVDSIISQYQRDLLSLIFLADQTNRNKVNLIIANEITPHLTAEEYMDKGEYENELKQVIGDTKAAYDISEHDTLVFGAYGLLVAGPNSRHHEPLLCAYLQFITIDIFMQNYFARLWILNDDMQRTFRIIDIAGTDPTALKRIRDRICKLANDIIQLEEILGYLLEALDIIEIPPEPPEQAGRSLYERLEISGMRSQLLRRTTDLKKNIGGASRYLEVLREMTHVASEEKMFALNQALELNTRRLCEMQEANERTAITLNLMQIMFAGMLCFDWLDRITGEWSVINTPSVSFLADLIRGVPFFWFLVSMIFWFIFWYAFNAMFNFYLKKSQGTLQMRVTYNRRIKTDQLNVWLGTKPNLQQEEHLMPNPLPGGGTETKIIKRTFEESDKELWGGTRPVITVEYDEKNKYLLTVTVMYNHKKANKLTGMTQADLQKRIEGQFNEFGIWDHEGDDHTDEMLAVDRRKKADEDAAAALAAEEEEEDE